MMDNPASPLDSAPARVLAGFGQRLLAFGIDVVITAAPCGLLGWAYYDFFTQHEGAAMLIGFVLTASYFALLGSSLGDGQTMGQKAVGIQVVDAQGNTVSLLRSIVRYLIVLTPFLVTSAVIPNSGSFALKALSDWLIGCAAFAIVYLYLFNRRTRQSLHDVATGTYVVAAKIPGSVKLPRVWGMHWVVLAGVTLITGVLLAMMPEISGGTNYSELAAIQHAVLRSDKVRSVSVSLRQQWMPGETNNELEVKVVWKSKPANLERDATEIAGIVMQTDPYNDRRNFITVISHQGFRIGFAGVSIDQPVRHEPATWSSLMENYGLP